MRGKRFAVLGVMCTLFAFLLTACGGGTGGSVYGNIGNTMTVVVSGVTTTYTVGPINGYGYYDPDMEADIYSDTGRTILMLSSGVTGSTTPNILINILTSGHTNGAYPVTGDNKTPGTSAYVLYKEGANYYDSVISSGTVTIDNIGNVGDPVIGSLSAVIALRSLPTTTRAISGTFNMKRAN